MILAPAKINLALHIVGRRADGYHLLDSLVAFADFGDRLLVEWADDFSLTCVGDYGDLLTSSGDNLVIRAARAMFDHAGKQGGVRVELRKQIPVGAGLGGGSADAAAVIRFLCNAWGLDLQSPAIRDLAAGIGADVPVCLSPVPQFMRGIGEQTQPAQLPGDVFMLLVHPGGGLSTAQVFGAYDHAAHPAMPEWSGHGDFIAHLASCRNDLEQAAIVLRPDIADLLSALEASRGCRLARMSGSGAACFGLYETEALVQAAAAEIGNKKPGWRMWPTRVFA